MLYYVNKIKEKYANNDFNKLNVLATTSNLFDHFLKNNKKICLYADMQSGKSQVMIKSTFLAYKYKKKFKKKFNIKINNVYVIICASSTELKNDIQNKFMSGLPNKLKKIYKIFHLDDIQKLLKNSGLNPDLPNSIDLTNLKNTALMNGKKTQVSALNIIENMTGNSLVFFDESHAVSEKEQTIDKLKKLIKYYINSQSYFVHISATNYVCSNENMPNIILEPGDGYYGIRDIYNKGRLFDSEDLKNPKNVESMFDIVLKRHKVNNNTLKKYFLIRVREEKCVDKIFENKWIKYDMHYNDNINNIIKNEPDKLTFIFVFNKLRMGVSIIKSHIACAYDYYNTNYSHTPVQSFVGRCCGYGENDIIIFSDVNEILNHLKWKDNGYKREFLSHNIQNVYKRGNRSTHERSIFKNDVIINK